jgi:hypothetical protein
MIQDRRKDQQQESRRGPKKVSTSDRSIATGRAKRTAAVNARRGMTESKKPQAMEIEREVYRQSRTTQKTKENQQQKATGGRLAPNASANRRAKKEAPIAAAKGANRRPPSKKIVQVGIKAMKTAGYEVPEGQKLVISLAPTVAVPAKNNQQKNSAAAAAKDSNNSNNNNNNRGRRGAGGNQSNTSGNQSNTGRNQNNAGGNQGNTGGNQNRGGGRRGGGRR